jgi:serine/threonine protein kinase
MMNLHHARCGISASEVTPSLSRAWQVVKKAFKRLTPIGKKWLAYQMLQSLWNIHSAGVVHNDVGNHNIVLRRNCTVKLIDFGNALPMPSALSKPTGKRGKVTNPMVHTVRGLSH